MVCNLDFFTQHNYLEIQPSCSMCQQFVPSDWEFGVSRCKLAYIGWINNKVLLYNTGNNIQYPVINHNGKEYEKEYMYV